MTIENDKKYKLTGEQIKDLASRFGVLSGEIGDLANLTTTDKTNLVAAINEAAAGGGGGSITELTTADYNYDFGRTGSNNGLAVWLMDAGTYYLGENMNLGFVTTGTTPYGAGCLLVVGEGTAHNYVIVVNNNSEMFVAETYSDGSVWNRNNILGKNNLKQTTGTSTTDVMSQNAVTSMVYADPATKYKIHLGVNGSISGNAATGIGYNIFANGDNSIAIGNNSTANGKGSIALGVGAKATSTGEVNIGVDTQYTTFGYNSSNYRLLTGLYDGQSAHDAATYGQLSTAILNGGTTAPTTATVGAVGTLYSYVDTTGATPTPHLMVCTVADTVTPSYTWVEAGGGGGSVETYNDSELEELWEGES